MKSLIRFLLASIFICAFGVTSIFAVINRTSTYDLKFYAENAQKLQNEDINELIKSAVELLKQNKLDEALAICAKAEKLSPNDFRPHYVAGLVYAAQMKLKNASEEFAKAISLKRDIKEIYLLKARADQLRNAHEEALVACRKALELDPSYAEAHLIIGETLRYDEKRRNEAIAAYQAVIKANPQLLAVYESLGETLIQAKDEKGAEEIFRKGMALDQRRMAGRFALGRLLVKQGRLKEAREIWDGRTSDEDNTFPNFITELERAEKLKEATDALAQKNDDPEVNLQMGLAVMEGDHWVVDGRQERAIVYFRKALKLKPNFAMAQYAICKAYIQIADTFKNKNKNVDEELAKLRKLDPKLAREMEEYRKTYSGGLISAPIKNDQ